MKTYTKLLCSLLILTLVCFCTISIFAEDTTTEPEITESPEVSATPKPVVATTQDTILAQELSTAYNITVLPLDIAELRVTNELGYGGIALLYGLANASGKTIDDIIALRQQDMGWGEIAKSLGLKVSDIMKKSSSVLKAAKMSNEEKKLQNELTKKPKEDKQNNKDNNNQNNGKNNQNTGTDNKKPKK